MNLNQYSLRRHQYEEELSKYGITEIPNVILTCTVNDEMVELFV